MTAAMGQRCRQEEGRWPLGEEAHFLTWKLRLEENCSPFSDSPCLKELPQMVYLRGEFQIRIIFSNNLKPVQFSVITLTCSLFKQFHNVTANDVHG